MAPKSAKNNLAIRLTESVVYLRGSVESTVTGRRNTTREAQPAMLRGLLTLALIKPTKISSIEITLEGKSQTAWPEGVGARKLEVTEEHEIFSSTTTYFRAGKGTHHGNATRRTASVGPGLILDVEEDDDSSNNDERDANHAGPSSNAQLQHDRVREQARRRETEPPPWLGDSRRRVSMDYHYLHLTGSGTPQPQTTAPPPFMLDDIPTPPYTPFTSTTPTQTPAPFFPHLAQRQESWTSNVSAGTVGSNSGRSIEHEISASASHLAGQRNSLISEASSSVGSFPRLTRQHSETVSQHSSNSDHSHRLSIHDVFPANSRRESMSAEDEHAASSVGHVDEYEHEQVLHERSQSRGRPRVSNGLTRSNDSREFSHTPSTQTTSPSITASLSLPPSLSYPPQRASSASSHVVPMAATVTTHPSSVHSPSHASQAGQEHDDTSSRSPVRDRGRERRRHARFSLAAVSNVLLDAVKEHVRSRSGSPAEGSHARNGRRPGKERAVTLGHEYGREESVGAGGVWREDDRGRSRSWTRDREGEDIHENATEKHKEKERSAFGKLTGALGFDAEEGSGGGSGDGWKEFRKGTYTYPISFAIPANSPPSLLCDFGSVIYRLKATVHRPGAFTHRLTAMREVTLIAAPGEDDLDESDNIVVQREWDTQLLYVIVISGRAFPIGSTIPIQVTFMPMAKIKVYRISVILEERVDYYTQFKRIARTDGIKKFELLNVRYHDKVPPPLLPLTSDYEGSPLYGLVDAPNDSEAASSLMGPGPWVLQSELQLPKSCAQMHFTNKHKRSNIGINHTLKIIFRVERGDDAFIDARTGKRKHFDIVVQTPIHILSCRCNPEWTSLPRYSCFDPETHANTASCPCRGMQADTALFTLSPTLPTAGAGPNTLASLHDRHVDGVNPGVHAVPEFNPSEGILSETSSLYQRNTQFARLMSGELSEAGEAPPMYDDVAFQHSILQEHSSRTVAAPSLR